MKKGLFAGAVLICTVIAGLGLAENKTYAGDGTESYYIGAGESSSVLLKDANIDGMTWDDSKHVLTLDNFSGNGAFGFFCPENAGDSEETTYTEIVLKGTNTIKLKEGDYVAGATYYVHRALFYGIEEGLKFSGNGTLNIEVPADMDFGIYSISNVDINGVTINIKTEAPKGSVIKAFDKLKINSAKLNVDFVCGNKEDEDGKNVEGFMNGLASDLITINNSSVNLKYGEFSGNNDKSYTYGMSSYNYNITSSTIKYTASENTTAKIIAVKYMDGFVAKDKIDKVVVGKGALVEDKNYTYRVTKAATESGKIGQLSVLRFRNGSAKKATIAKMVNIYGLKYNPVSIVKAAFKNEKKLQTLVIGDNIKSIGKNAFFGCKKLKKVTIKGNGLKTIGKKAFYRKKGKKITFVLPKSKKKLYSKKIKSAKTNNYKVR